MRTGSRRNSVVWFLGYALKTITSPVFSELVLFYRDFDFPAVSRWRMDPDADLLKAFNPSKIGIRDRDRVAQLECIRRFRDFQLVFCADVWERLGEHSVREWRTLRRATCMVGSDLW